MYTVETPSLQLINLLINKFMKVPKKILIFFDLPVISVLRWKIFLFVFFRMTAKNDYKNKQNIYIGIYMYILQSYR